MRALFVKERTSDGVTERVINLDRCTLIEFDAEGPTLDFWLAERGLLRLALPRGAKESPVMDRLKMALAPLYEGRMNQIMGIRMDLNLLDL